MRIIERRIDPLEQDAKDGTIGIRETPTTAGHTVGRAIPL